MEAVEPPAEEVLAPCGPSVPAGAVCCPLNLCWHTCGVQSSAAHEQHLFLFGFHQMRFSPVNLGLKPLALELCISISKTRSCNDFSAFFPFCDLWWCVLGSLSPEPPYSSACQVSSEESGLLSCFSWALREVQIQDTELL